MYKFALRELDEVIGTIRFHKLVVDDVCLFDEFYDQIKHEANLVKQLKTILARMNEIANQKLLPHNKFKDITPQKEKIKEFEIKTGDLRVYLIKEHLTGHIIIFAGKKNSQKEDIRKFRSLKKSYLNR